MEKFYDIDDDRVNSYEKCVANYIAYYHKKSKEYKSWYIGLSIFKIAVTALIPVLEILPLSSIADIKSALIVGAGAGILITESVLALMNAKEKWISYRSTCDILCHEQRLFSTRTGVYTKEDGEAFDRYVQSVEDIVVKESKHWTKLVEKSKAEKPAEGPTKE